MLPKKHRLTFQQFQKKSHKSIYRKLNLLKVLIKKSSNSNTRLVVTVPKSLDKRSVYRHRTKRIIIEAVRLLLPKLNTQLDVLIRANKIFTKKDHGEIVNELTNALGKLR